MFISADLFFQHLLFTKVLWIRGLLGSGKTLLAFAIADYLLRTGDYRAVVANIPHVLRIPTDGTVENCICLLDEAHEFIDSRTFQTNSKDYGAYARKLDCLWLFPSVNPIDVRVRSLFCERVLKLGNLLWWYKGGLEISYTKLELSFGLFKPSKYFGLYDTRSIPFSDGGVSFLYNRTVSLRRAETEANMIESLAMMGVPIDELRRVGK